jgi:hypothetical protein
MAGSAWSPGCPIYKGGGRRVNQLFAHRFLLLTVVYSCCLLLAPNKLLQAQVATDTVAVEVPSSEEEDYTDEEEKEETFNQRNTNEPFTSSQRNVSQKAYNELKNDDAFWYADGTTAKEKTKPTSSQGEKGETGQTSTPPKVKEQKANEYKEEEPVYTPVRKRSWFNTLMLILAIVGFAAIIGWYLVSSNVGLFRKKDIKANEVVGEEDMPEDIFAINYIDEVDKAVADGNYRLAIRLQYLRLLKTLAEKNIIAYKQDKTNFDYLSELYNTQWYDGFFRITRNYEFSWYGKFEVSKETYHQINLAFIELNNKLKY